MKSETEQALNAFIEEWQDTSATNKKIFVHFKDYLNHKEGVLLDFIARPGLTYSLRGVHKAQKDKDLFVMVDVIEDATRWLSICFYGNMITDPEERGDFVPGGLLGEDAVCFDLEEQDDALVTYIETRLDEAWLNASSK
ncbi:hypothetical protein UWK_01545 [Desulfocapsa sulfexigens DSM 10523]|uniref:DUF5655 domain-containing protein n=1 Tax=Desulfocapsa sulfexigens (strain DSM 10523 / SB164P1) TaxID=1167006 RepID=M1P3Q5_DESSD|nr:hypothetical protein [Desulfocapsa sulfexigens]AGF78103.1 hypothetical protein UWK_01545 [Desulfocapsa sulfexigens DSM 10523]